MPYLHFTNKGWCACTKELSTEWEDQLVYQIMQGKDTNPIASMA